MILLSILTIFTTILNYIKIHDNNNLYYLLSMLTSYFGFIIYYYYYNNLGISLFFLITSFIFNLFISKNKINYITIINSTIFLFICFQVIYKFLKFFW